MNVLIFVMAMLMLLSLMTYARLESFRSSQSFQSLFNHYMEKDERGYVNKMAERKYMTIKASSKSGKPGSKSKIDANPRISLALLKDKKLRTSKPTEWQQTVLLLKNLMQTLYADQPFFQKMIQEHPSFVDELISNLTQVIDGLPNEKKLAKASDLANLSLTDEELDQVFYKMLHGAPYKKDLEIPQKSIPIESTEKDEGNFDDELLKQQAEEFQSPKGYFSLLDFVTFSPSSKIRVFLAPREVLKTIYHDPDIVNNILTDRKILYNEAASGADLKDLTVRFKSQFDHYRDPNIQENVLDYTITKTNPKNYE